MFGEVDMTEDREDPSGSAEAFQAFVQLTEPDVDRRPGPLIATLAVVLVVVAVIAFLIMR
jgi:hypothetical protein